MALDFEKDDIIEAAIVEETKKQTKTVNYKPVTKHYKLLGFLEVVTLILMVAKLTGYTTISWFWVFVPVVLHAVIVIVVIAVIIIVFLVALIVAAIAS